MQGGGALIALPPTQPLLVLARRGRPSWPITLSGSSLACWVCTWPRAGQGRLGGSPGTPGWRHPEGGGGPTGSPGTPACSSSTAAFLQQMNAERSLALVPCKAWVLSTHSSPANADLNRSSHCAGEVEPEAVGETLLPGKSGPKKEGQSNKPASSLGDIATGCHLPAPLPAGGTTANRTSKGPTTAR